MSRGLLVGLFSVATSILFFPVLNLARELNIENEPQADAERFQPEIDWVATIGEGVELLERSEPLKYETRNKKPTGELVRKQIVLAILDKKTGEIFEYRVWVREQEIKNYKKTGVINLEPDSKNTNPHTKRGLVSPCAEGTCPRSGVGVNWWNSFNTDYGFPDNPDLVVVANKYLLPSNQLGTLPERSKNSPPHQTATGDCAASKQKWPFWCGGKYTEIIYVPYSAGLHKPEIVEAGKKYIEENIDIAFGQLESAGVISRFTPGQMVTADIKKEFIKNIILVEHIDPDAFRMADDGGKELVERVLALIGTNKKKAYRYTGSPAGASGLAQFIRPTYQNIISKYPRAGMIKDYTLGMANHVNAIKAMVLFFDEHKKALASRITRKDITKPLGPVRGRPAEGAATTALGRSASNGVGITEEMLAAAYNGGPARVSRSINKFGLAWIGSQLRLPSSQKILRSETLNYVEKFRSIKQLDIF